MLRCRLLRTIVLVYTEMREMLANEQAFLCLVFIRPALPSC